MAELAEEYSDGIAHVTTRQDFQLHFIHIENGPSLMRRLAAVGITTREACGNAVRNVTACPFAGVCRDETFDVSPYAHALAWFLDGHPDTLDFGRKFKPSFSGCSQHPCGLTQMHDIGYTATVREVEGKLQRGFKIVVGGGLGPVPRQARVLTEFAPVEELLPLTQAACESLASTAKKRTATPPASSSWWTSGALRNSAKRSLPRARNSGKTRAGSIASKAPRRRWKVRSSRQGNFPPWTATTPSSNGQGQRPRPASVRLCHRRGHPPAGRHHRDQLRALADIVARYTRGTIRTTVEQNFLIRWVSKSDVAALFADLEAVHLGQPGAGSIVDVTACPGTDTCKLGISSSRGLGGELRNRLVAKSQELDEAVTALHIKVSGCFNSCGVHHVADLGFYGVSRTVNGYKVPHFQVVLGGQWENNAGSYGLPIIAIPSKRAPDAVDRITDYYVKHREKAEKFTPLSNASAKARSANLLEPLNQNLPSHSAEPGLYSDWGDPRQYSIGDIGVGNARARWFRAFNSIDRSRTPRFRGRLASG